MENREMPGFMTYREIALIYTAIDDETAGKVIKAVCDYFWFRKKETCFTDKAKYIYDMMVSSIDRGQESYNATCVKNAENGAKGGRPRKNRLETQL